MSEIDMEKESIFQEIWHSVRSGMLWALIIALLAGLLIALSLAGSILSNF